MPKKGAKKEEVANDGDVVPKNDVIFNINFEVYHEKGHFIKLKYTWLNPDTLEAEETETDYLKDWEVLRRDGEEENPEAEEKKDDKKKGAKDPKKGGMEEIDDPVPTVVKFNKSFEESPLKITEEVAKKWSDFNMKINVYLYNHETSEDELKDSVQIDLSFFLFPEEKINEEWEFDKLNPHSMNYLK